MSQSTSEPLTTATPALEVPARRKFRFDNRYVAPLFITCILLVGHLSYGILESYKKTALAIVAALITELILGRIFFGKWLESCQCLHHGNQRRDSGPLARLLALRAVQRHLDNVEVRLASEGTPHLESVQLWHRGVVVSGAGDNGRSQHSVGKQLLVAVGYLDSGLDHHLARPAVSH